MMMTGKLYTGIQWYLMENRSYTLEFDNNSNPRGYWVTIQGVTKSGKMVYYQKLIEKADQ